MYDDLCHFYAGMKGKISHKTYHRGDIIISNNFDWQEGSRYVCVHFFVFCYSTFVSLRKFIYFCIKCKHQNEW